MIALNILILLVSLFVLIKSSDYFVDSSSKIAKHFGISNLVIGLTLVAIGTSLPELASSVVASLRGQADMAIGNVIGSNIANILLILGIAAIVANMKTTREMLDRDGMIMVFASIVFYWILVLAGFNVFIKSSLVIRLCGIFLIVLFVAYIIFLIRRKQYRINEHRFEEFMKYIIQMGFVREAGVWLAERDLLGRKGKKKTRAERLLLINKDIWRQALILVASCGALVISAHFFIDQAIWLAESLHVTGGVIGMTLVALGTSLPELMVCVIAAKKGLGDMAIGNVMGSSIVNILLVGGVSISLAPAILPKVTLLYTVPFMVFTAALLLVFVRTDWELRKSEGIVFVLLYAIFLLLIYKGMLV
ncbi:MAG: calcium/sodium antiporter [Nanoarchaeota archaeon]|nr:calcium/sodium antiporter [Nanoarchaeota archaeon]